MLLLVNHIASNSKLLLTSILDKLLLAQPSTFNAVLLLTSKVENWLVSHSSVTNAKFWETSKTSNWFPWQNKISKLVKASMPCRLLILLLLTFRLVIAKAFVSSIFPFKPLVSNPKPIKACSKLVSGIAMVVVLLQSVLKDFPESTITCDVIASVFIQVKLGVFST